MYSPIAECLGQRPLLFLDGALATELEQRGADLNDPLWSAKYLLEEPELIRAVHLDYFLAGADVATTATYQASFEAFERRGLARGAAARVMREAVALAAAARDDFWSRGPHPPERVRPLVAASVGPYGAMLADGSEYRGHYGVSERALAEFHRPRLDVLADAGADLLACETLPSLREALVLARLLEEYPISAWLSFSCRDGAHDCEGDPISRCAAALADHPKIAAIGVNCSRPEFLPDLLAAMRAETSKPLVAYPNSGERYDASAKRWCGAAEHRPFAEQADEWVRAGAKLLGGCCRTTPADIASLRRRQESGAAALIP